MSSMRSPAFRFEDEELRISLSPRLALRIGSLMERRYWDNMALLALARTLTTRGRQGTIGALESDEYSISNDVRLSLAKEFASVWIREMDGSVEDDPDLKAFFVDLAAVIGVRQEDLQSV